MMTVEWRSGEAAPLSCATGLSAGPLAAAGRPLGLLLEAYLVESYGFCGATKLKFARDGGKVCYDDM